MRKMVVLLFLVLPPVQGLPPATAVAREPPEGVLAIARDRGFAVDAESPSGLAAVYRWSRTPPFVSTDAVLAAYDLLLRRVLDARARHREEAVLTALGAWAESADAAPDGDAGRYARFYTSVLLWLAGLPTGEAPADVRDAAERQAMRLFDESEPTGRVEVLGTPIDERAFPAFRSAARNHAGERWFGTVLWLTRVSLPATPEGREARRLLAASMPVALRDALASDTDWLGVSRLALPGPEGAPLASLADVDERRFPPGTLPDRADRVGLDIGRRLGSAFAARRAPADGTDGIRDRTPPPAGSLAVRYEALLARTLTTPDEAAPAMFRSEAWQARALQSALAARAVFRWAAGSLVVEGNVYGGPPRGFVHPDPAFFRAAAAIARETAAEAKATGVSDPAPDEKSDLDTAIRRIECFPALAKLEELASCCEGFARIAERQLREGDPPADAKGRPDPDAAFDAFGYLCESLDPGSEGLLRVCSGVLADGPLHLTHGTGGLRDLWVAYPWQGTTVVARGVVFDYREYVGPRVPGEGEWADLVRAGAAKRPSWAASPVAEPAGK